MTSHLTRRNPLVPVVAAAIALVFGLSACTSSKGNPAPSSPAPHSSSKSPTPTEGPTGVNATANPMQFTKVSATANKKMRNLVATLPGVKGTAYYPKTKSFQVYLTKTEKVTASERTVIINVVHKYAK